MNQLFILLITFLALSYEINGQTTIAWDDNYLLQLSDFQSPATQIGEVDMYSMSSGSSFTFAFHMSNAEFMFTKNFNAKVDCSFMPSTASIVAPDSAIAQMLLNFARYEFDLAELYARKFRKRIFEEKGAFSDPSIFHSLYDEVHQAYSERRTMAAKHTNMGINKEALKKLHQEAAIEINQLEDFCKSCKPPKKAKEKQSKRN